MARNSNRVFDCGNSMLQALHQPEMAPMDACARMKPMVNEATAMIPLRTGQKSPDRFAPSMRHQNRDHGAFQHSPRGPTQNCFAQAGMAIGAHHHHVGVAVNGMLGQHL